VGPVSIQFIPYCALESRFFHDKLGIQRTNYKSQDPPVILVESTVSRTSKMVGGHSLLLCGTLDSNRVIRKGTRSFALPPNVEGYRN
jgi:hypothetical protein